MSKIKIDTATSEFEVAITAKVDRKVLNVTNITVDNLATLGLVFEAIGEAVARVSDEAEAEQATKDEG